MKLPAFFVVQAFFFSSLDSSRSMILRTYFDRGISPLFWSTFSQTSAGSDIPALLLADIADMLHLSVPTVSDQLKALVKNGKILTDGKGKYYPKKLVETLPNLPDTSDIMLSKSYWEGIGEKIANHKTGGSVLRLDQSRMTVIYLVAISLGLAILLVLIIG